MRVVFHRPTLKSSPMRSQPNLLFVSVSQWVFQFEYPPGLPNNCTCGDQWRSVQLHRQSFRRKTTHSRGYHARRTLAEPLLESYLVGLGFLELPFDRRIVCRLLVGRLGTI